MTEEIKPLYTKLKQWKDHYGSAGITDQRAVEEFIICEADESINALRFELQLVVSGKFEESVFDILIGNKRKARHGSYVEWAKLMLQWMASFKG